MVPQVEGIVGITILKATPPSLNGLPADTAFGNCSAHRITCQKKQEDDLPHFPKIPATRRNALRQHRASRIAFGAVETRDGNRVQGIALIGFAGIATVTPNSSMAATGTTLGAIRLWFFPKCANVLQEGKNVWKNDGHAWSPLYGDRAYAVSRY
ncbi:MAG: hypothetical protein H7Y42_08925 [Chitinophagaceae bacterium]|nr:hypothetical protein [Chitinophagaceae bacterium]